MDMEQTIDTRTGRFHIRPYMDEDEAAVISLWKAAFGKEISQEVWRWKYHQPQFGRRIFLCLTSENVPVVMFSCMPYPALFFGNHARIGHAVDSMSHPDFRGTVSGRKGLFALTAKSFFDHYGRKDDLMFIYGFPGERHFRLGNILLDYTPLINSLLYFMFKSANIKKRVKMFKGGLGSIKGDDPGLDYLSRKIRNYYPFAVLRDSGFMNWRYEQHPLTSYQIFTYHSYFGRDIKGFMVIRLEDHLASIVDMFMPADHGMIIDFMARACGHLNLIGFTDIRIWLPENHFQALALKSLGIEPVSEPLGIIPSAVARDFHPNFPHKIGMQNIFYTMADGDIL